MSEYIIRQDKDRVLNPSEYDLIEEKNRKEGVILAEKNPEKDFNLK